MNTVSVWLYWVQANHGAWTKKGFHSPLQHFYTSFTKEYWWQHNFVPISFKDIGIYKYLILEPFYDLSLLTSAFFVSNISPSLHSIVCEVDCYLLECLFSEYSVLLCILVFSLGMLIWFVSANGLLSISLVSKLWFDSLFD